MCPDPDDIDNGRVTFTSTFVGDIATYSCNEGFELIGGVNTTCTPVNVYFAVFVPAPPFCRREYILTLMHAYNCKVSGMATCLVYTWMILGLNEPRVTGS